jgi:hypothetical protein
MFLDAHFLPDPIKSYLFEFNLISPFDGIAINNLHEKEEYLQEVMFFRTQIANLFANFDA